MTVTEAVKSALGLADAASARMYFRCCQLTMLILSAAASREAMSEARLPLAYRDSCANLLIPLNRCRYEEYYLPWKCEVR
jgi:NADH dehydrogenase (ubiquinone) 1 beta subcomplex subunit 7